MQLGILHHTFTQLFGVAPQHIYRAPGRVNLIGEHTDYNDGFVLPMAIDRAVYIAARPRADRVVRLCALDFQNARSEFALDALIARDETNTWSNYIRGVAWTLQARGFTLPGLALAIQGDVPLDSGLSSSAALEVCAATTFVEMGGLEIGQAEIARACQQAESEFVGMKCGIMDQFISALARADHALVIDCRALSYQNVPLPRGAQIVVCDTMKRRGLVDSEYNTRRAECEQAVRLLAAQLGKPLRALRGVSPEEFARYENDLPRVVAKRARHVITENARVLDAVAAAKRNDLATFGTLMNASHASLRDDYQVSCAELDAMVEIACQQRGCLGARLTGAGFGGCTVNLVEDDVVDAFISNVAREYHAHTGLSPQIFACRAMAGAGAVD
jgi:galactokinase